MRKQLGAESLITLLYFTVTELRQILSDHLNKSEADAEEQEKQAPSPPRDEKQSPSPPTDGKPQVPDKKR